MAARKDYYEILGVSRTASPQEIKRTFRRLARDSHPDANPEDPASEARFREIAEAYEVLSDAGRRAAYDRGEQLGDLFSTFAGFDDLLDLLLGSSRMAGFGAGRTSTRPGRDVSMRVEIDLEEAAFGSSREVSFPVAVGCETCRGSGAAPGSGLETCGRCGGSGALRVTRRGLLGSLMSVTACDRCGGNGRVIEDPCSGCLGTGVVDGTRTITVAIPAGVTDRSRLRLGGQGESGPRNAPNGDLFIEIRVKPHEEFSRAGDDLRHRLRLGIAQAALGIKVDIPLLEGGSVNVEVPRGSQPGTSVRVPGKGMTRLGRRGRGDLIVELDVTVPTDLSSEEEEALRAFAQHRGEQVERPRRRSRF